MVEYDIGEPYAVQAMDDQSISYQFQKAPDTANIPYSYIPGNLQVFGQQGFATDAGWRVDDKQVGANILWSSQRTADLTDHRGIRGNFVTYDGKGRLVDSQMSVDSIVNSVLSNVNSEYVNEMVETASIIASDKATSECYARIQPTIETKVNSMVGNKLDTVPVYTTSNIPIFNTTGQLEDSQVSIDKLLGNISSIESSVDSAVKQEVQNMYTILKSENEKALATTTSALTSKIAAGDKQVQSDVTQLINQQITSLKSKDQTLDNDIATLNANLMDLQSDKINIVQPSKSGNIPVLDAVGQLTDSGLTVQQFQTCADQIQQMVTSTQNAEVQLENTMFLVPGAKAGNTAIFDANGQTIDSGINMKNLSAAVTQLESEMNQTLAIPLQTKPNNLPVFDINGQLIDSKVNVTNLMNKVSGGTSGNLTILDAGGQIKDSGYRVDDTVISPSNLWSSGAIAVELDEKVTRPVSFTTGNLAVFDAVGNIVDGGTLPSPMVYNPPVKSTPVVTMDALGKPIESDVQVQNLLIKRVPKTEGAIAVLKADGQLSDSNVLVSQLQNRIVPSRPGNLVSMDTTGQVTDSTYRVNDTLVDPQVLWTSVKTSSALDKKLSTPSSFIQDSLPVFDASGQLVDSRMALSSVMKRDPLAKANHLAVYDSTGQTMGSQYKVDDYEPPDSDILYTSLKTKTMLDELSDSKLDKPYTSAPGELPMFDANGQLMSSGMSLSSLASQLATGAVPSQPLVVPSKSMNLAALGTNGTIVDSGKSINELLARPQVSVLNHIATFDAAGQLQDNGLVLNDSNTVAASHLWSSQKTQSELDKRMRVLSVYNAGNVTVIDADGHVKDSQISLTRLIPAIPSTGDNISMLSTDGRILDSGVKKSSLLTVPSTYTPSNLPAFDSSGHLVDSLYKIDDMQQPSSQVVYSSSKTTMMMNQLLQTAQQLQPTAVAGNFAVWNPDGQTVDSMYKVDDAAAPAPLVLYSSSKINSLLQNVHGSTINVAGTAVISNCVSLTWVMCTLTGCTPLATSLLSSDRLAVVVPKSGCYKFSFYVYEKSKNVGCGYAIEQRASNMPDAVFQLTTITLPVKSFHQVSRVFTLTAGNEICFRTFQRDNCVYVDKLEWCMEELS